MEEYALREATRVPQHAIWVATEAGQVAAWLLIRA